MKFKSLIQVILFFLFLIHLTSSSSVTKSSKFSHFTKLFKPIKRLFSSKSELTTVKTLLSTPDILLPVIDNSSLEISFDEQNNRTTYFDLDSVDLNLSLINKNSSKNTENTPAHSTSLYEEKIYDTFNENILNDTINREYLEQNSEKSYSQSVLTTQKSSMTEKTNDFYQLAATTIKNNFSSTKLNPIFYMTKTEVLNDKQELPRTEALTTEVYSTKKLNRELEDSQVCYEVKELKIKKCYHQVPNTSNFNNAKNYCESHFKNGKLITLNTIEEQKFLILNTIYYFWTSFKVKLGLSLDLKPHIAAIRPIYKQNSNSIKLIKEFKFIQNSLIHIDEIDKITKSEEWADYPTNDADAYDIDDIRVQENEDTEIMIIIPKLYCVEAGLFFENGQPMYKWLVKDCDNESSSAVCETIEINEEEILKKIAFKEKIFKIKSLDNKQNKTLVVLKKDEMFLPKEEKATFAKNKDLISDLFDDNEKSTVAPLNETTITLTTILSTITPKINPATMVLKEILNETSSIYLSKNNSSDEKIQIKEINITKTRNYSETKTYFDSNYLVLRLFSTVNILFNNFCLVILNTIKKLTNSDSQLSESKIIYSSITMLILILLFLIIFLSMILIYKLISKVIFRKRKLLLVKLSEKPKVSISKELNFNEDFDDYYDLPLNRNFNIYVSNPGKTIPKDYFFFKNLNSV